MSSEIIAKNLAKYDTEVKLISTLAIVVTSILAIIGGYTWWKNNIWVPDIQIISADFDNAIAQLTINGEQATLYGNDILSAGGNWGVRFGTTGASSSKYDTIETVKTTDSMVYNILKQSIQSTPIA